MKLLERFWDFVDKRGVIRRIALGVAVWSMVWASIWGMRFADAVLADPDANLADGAMLITAVTAPLVALCGYMFKTYLGSREDK